MAFRAIQPIDSNKFTFRNNMFTCEASDLTGLYVGAIYDDACDEGFAMCSIKTNEVVYFYLANEVKDEENDTLYWDFLVCDEFIRKNKTLANISVRVYND